MHVSFTGAGRDALDHALSRAPAHLRPAFLAVRDHGCGFVLAAQGSAPFRVPKDRPAIVVVGDDLAEALSPPGSMRGRCAATSRDARLPWSSPAPRWPVSPTISPGTDEGMGAPNVDYRKERPEPI